MYIKAKASRDKEILIRMDEEELEKYIKQLYSEFIYKFLDDISYERFKEIILISCNRTKPRRYYLTRHWQDQVKMKKVEERKEKQPSVAVEVVVDRKRS